MARAAGPAMMRGSHRDKLLQAEGPVSLHGPKPAIRLR
jgi:hypothetical protein